MLRKEEILERTSNGLAVFKHYLPGNWRIGRNFLNPLYEDSKASCNIYFDRRGGIYKMKDFGLSLIHVSVIGDMMLICLQSKDWEQLTQHIQNNFLYRHTASSKD